MTNSVLFQRVLELILDLCTLGGSRGDICPGMGQTAYVTHRSYTKTSVYCVLYDMRGALGLRCLSMSGTFTTLSTNWTSTGFCTDRLTGNGICLFIFFVHLSCAVSGMFRLVAMQVGWLSLPLMTMSDTIVFVEFVTFSKVTDTMVLPQTFTYLTQVILCFTE